MTGTLHLVNAVGMKVEFEIASEDEAYTMMREFGAKGWTSGEVPAGGYLLPYALADRFDWSLIGAKALTIDGDAGVMHRGLFYKRRDLAEKRYKEHTMPACIKYSRGAKPTDANAEGGDDDVNYVTLISFKGKAPIDERLAVPRQRPQPRGEELANRIADGSASVDDAPATEELRRAIYQAAKDVGIPHADLQAIVFRVTLQHDYREAKTAGQQRTIFDWVSHWKAGAA